MPHVSTGKRRERRWQLSSTDPSYNLLEQGDSNHETCRFYGWGRDFKNLIAEQCMQDDVNAHRLEDDG